MDTYGAGRARSIRSLCLFLHWGSLGGNTLNHSVSQLAQGNISAFRAGYVTWYGPLFGVIALMNAISSILSLLLLLTLFVFIFALLGMQGGNSQEKNCLENCRENVFENCLEIPYTRKMGKMSS